MKNKLTHVQVNGRYGRDFDRVGIETFTSKHDPQCTKKRKIRKKKRSAVRKSM